MSFCGCKRESWIGVVVEERQLERGRDCEKGYSILVLYLEDQKKKKKLLEIIFKVSQLWLQGLINSR